MRVCKYGHKLKPENIYVSPNGQRTYKTCRQACAREYYQRNSEKIKAYKRTYYEQQRDMTGEETKRKAAELLHVP